MNQKYNTNKPSRPTRVVGDNLYFFLLSNLISALLFAIFTFSLGLFNSGTLTLTETVSFYFFDLLLSCFLISIITSIIGRVVAYITLKVIFEIVLEKSIKKAGEYLTGINKLGLSFIIASFLSTFLFCLGIFPIIQSQIFGINTLTTAIWTYFIIKVGVFTLTRLFSSFKL